MRSMKKNRKHSIFSSSVNQKIMVCMIEYARYVICNKQRILNLSISHDFVGRAKASKYMSNLDKYQLYPRSLIYNPNLDYLC
jgi:hypothetical protein